MPQYTITTKKVDVALMLIPLAETFEASDSFGQWNDFDFSTSFFFDGLDYVLISVMDFMAFHPNAFRNDDHIERLEKRLLETVERLRSIRHEHETGDRDKMFAGDDE